MRIGTLRHTQNLLGGCRGASSCGAAWRQTRRTSPPCSVSAAQLPGHAERLVLEGALQHHAPQAPHAQERLHLGCVLGCPCQGSRSCPRAAGWGRPVWQGLHLLFHPLRHLLQVLVVLVAEEALAQLGQPVPCSSPCWGPPGGSSPGQLPVRAQEPRSAPQVPRDGSIPRAVQKGWARPNPQEGGWKEG